jgi:hypothetical protein
LSASTNVATFNLAPGYVRYHTFCHEAEIQDDEILNPLTMDVTAVSDDEDDQSVHVMEDNDLPQPASSHQSPRQFDLDLHSTPREEPVIIHDDDEDRQPESTAAEFLRYHIKYNHCSPRRIQLLAATGVLPKRLAKCQIPICSACQFGKATRRPWRQKTTRTTSDSEQIRKPGQVVSVDQMVSQTPGLVAQMSGFLTKKRYKVATVFVDHYSNLSYVHLQCTTSAKETLEAKEAFERYAEQSGVTVETLPRRQWHLRSKRMGTGMLQQVSRTYLCECKRPPSKWKGGD